jgi:Glycosyltransferase family 87
MREDVNHGERPMLLSTGPVAGAGAGQADTTVSLPGLEPLGARLRVPRTRVTFGPLSARVALGAIILGAFAVVVFASARPSVLVPRAWLDFPNWESGPLHGLFGHGVSNGLTLSIGLSVVVVVMLAAYGVVLAAWRTLSARSLIVCVVVLHAILLLSPPLQLTDVFNYLGYARLGGLHHLNPYTHVINNEVHDPVYRFSSWHNLRSPYGPLFTALSYPLAWMSLPLAYWTLKIVTVLASLGLIALLWRVAQMTGRDPRFVLVFVVLNPLYLMYELGGFHNDVFLLLPTVGAIALLLAGRDRAAGAAVALAVAIKFTAVLILPFMLIAVVRRRQIRILTGAALAAAPLVVMSVALFGFALPNLSDQSTLLTDFSIPNIFGWAIGLGGGAPGLLRAADIAVVLVVVYLIRRPGDWLAKAGWATLALIASLPWLLPWYVVWVLPLAALATSTRLRRATIALTVFLAVTFIPVTGIVLFGHGINPMNSAVGRASSELQQKLSQ